MWQFDVEHKSPIANDETFHNHMKNRTPTTKYLAKTKNGLSKKLFALICLVSSTSNHSLIDVIANKFRNPELCNK